MDGPLKAQPVGHQEHVVVLLRAKTQGCAPLPIFGQRVQHERKVRMRERAKHEGESQA